MNNWIKTENSAEKFFLKRVLFCCFKTKNRFLKKTFVLKQAHISTSDRVAILSCSLENHF